MEDSGIGECSPESVHVSIIASTDDESCGLGDCGKLRSVGGRAAVVGADEQAAGWEEREELLLSGAFEITGETELMSGEAEYCGEAGFVVGAGGAVGSRG